jgi:glycine oxidase
MLETLGIQTGILPVRGQMVLYRCPEPPFSMVLNEGHRYLVPRDDGHVLAGSCEEEVGFDASTTPEMIADLRAWAESIWPALAEVPVANQWAGLRPGSFDSFPYLGTLPGLENAYIACGHFRHGLHWSTATAVLLFQAMSGEPTSIDLEPFRVQRGHAIGKSSPST